MSSRAHFPPTGDRTGAAASSSKDAETPETRSISSQLEDVKKQMLLIAPPNSLGTSPRSRGSSATSKPTSFPINPDNNSKSSAQSLRPNIRFENSISPRIERKNDVSEAKYQAALEKSGIFRIDDKDIKIEQKDMKQESLIGSGTCGNVFRMRHIPTNTAFAVKIMSRTTSVEENKRIIMDLDVISRSADSPFIVRCFGYFVRTQEVWIGMELMTSCFEKITKTTKKPVPEEVLGKLTFSIVTALNYLKERHDVIHRDVKPSNILINDQGEIKLCDFGISGFLIESVAKTRDAGCVAYMSPERIEPENKEKPVYDIRADVWSLGITLIELATSRHPFAEFSHDFSLSIRIVQGNPPELPENMEFSDEFRCFVDNCLTKKCIERPKYGALMTHAFFIHSRDRPVDVVGWYQSLGLNTSNK